MLMVNLEEMMGENKRFYEPPRMTIKRIDFTDVIVTSNQQNLTEDKDYTQGNGDDQLDDPFGG